MTGKELYYIAEAHFNGALAGDGPFTRRCHAWLKERPSDYYFIVNIDDQLELGHAKAGADTAWYEQPQLWHQVSNPKLIKRFEHRSEEQRCSVQIGRAHV